MGWPGAVGKKTRIPGMFVQLYHRCVERGGHNLMGGGKGGFRDRERRCKDHLARVERELVTHVMGGGGWVKGNDHFFFNKKK